MTGPYTAYGYLGDPPEFPRFELSPEFGRVPPYAAGLTGGQQARAAALLRDSLVISLHDHPVRFPADMDPRRRPTTGPAASTPGTPGWPPRA